jgi:hypothetical protein
MARISRAKGVRNLAAWESPHESVRGAFGIIHVLGRCGNDLSRENIMRQATSIKDLVLPLALPGLKINTSRTDYRMVRQYQLQRFEMDPRSGTA